MLALATTMALVSGSQAVYAQGNQEVEEILVTGFKASLQNSLDMKRNSESLVEAVSAEDIGKLPDRSIAESLARLPGLTTQRVNGRAQIISIRGMGPDFNTTLLNGRQQVNTGDNRSVEFDQYPSEFITAATVYKTPDSSVVGQGIGGTVNLETVKPLKYGKRAIVGSVSYEENSIEALNSDVANDGGRASISYIDQFADDTFGVALAFSHMDSPTQVQHFNSWGYPTNDNGDFIIGGAKPFVQSITVKRDSYMGAFEYTPNENFTTSLDVFYSEFEEDNVKRGIEIPLQWSSAQLQPGYTVEDGVISAGQFKNVNGVIRSDGEFREADVYAVGWNTQFAMGDEWTGEVDISTSKAKREDEIIENYSGQTAGPDTLNFVRTDEGYTFTSAIGLDYSNAEQVRLGNLQSWGGSWVAGNQQGYYKRPNIDDELTQYRFSGEREIELGIFNSVELGANYDTRTKDKSTFPEFFLDFGYEADGVTPVTGRALPGKTILTDLSFLGFQSIVSYDPIAAFNNPSVYRKISGDERSDVADKAWTVSEDITTLFVKTGIDTELGSVPVTGNLGLQWVHSDQSSQGLAATGQNPPGQTPTYVAVELDEGTSYDDFLPSLNLSFNLTDADKVRVGLARTLTRTRMDDLRASSAFGLSTQSEKLNETSNILNSPWSATAGNPTLKPWISDNADLSYEHYLEDGIGYFSGAVFYKELKSFVYNQSEVIDFTGFPYDPALAPKMFLGLGTIPVNGDGGKVQGLEFSLSLTGEILSESLAPFGLLFASSYTESDIETQFDNSRLPGLSKNVHGVTFFFEQAGFSARVSGNYRSDFLGELAGFDARRNQKVVDATETIDAQISYAFEDGALDGLTVSLEGINLTDEPLVTYQGGNKNLISDFDSYGATYSMRLNYKFQ